MNGLLLNMLDDFLANDFVRVILDVLSFIPKIMYFLVTCLLSVLDLFQVVFRKLAGLDPIMIDGEITTGDSTYKLIMDALFTGKYPALNTIFWSLIILGVFMLIVTSIIATIRVEYNPDKEKGNSKGKIVGNFIKGLFSLLIIPIASIFGMYFANSLVGIVDTITSNTLVTQSEANQYFDTWGTEDIEADFKSNYKPSYISYNVFGLNIPTTAEPFSGMVFKASAYSCNRFRLYGAEYLQQVNQSDTDLGIFKDGQINESSTAADIIDTAFAINAKIKSGVGKRVSANNGDTQVISDDYYRSIIPLFGSTRNNLTSFSKYNVELVYFFYDLWSFNYIVAFVAVIVIAKLYSQFCLMLFARIFEILGLFIFAPIAVGIMPVDGGGALGRWRNTFIGKFGLIFVTIFGMNIITPIIAIMQQVKFFGSPVVDYVVQTIMIVAALSAVSGLISSFSTILFDKATAYDSSLKAAGDASNNLTSGFNASKKLFNDVTGVTVGAPARLLGRTAMGAYHVGRDHRYNARQSDAIRDGLAYNRAEQESRFATMSQRERRAWGENFLNSAEGQTIMANVKGRNDAERRSRALEMIENNNFDGRRFTGGAAERDAAREAMLQFRHEQNVFDHSTVGEGVAGRFGTAEYSAAMNNFNNMSERQQVREIRRGSTPLNRQQADIRTQRQMSDNRRERRRQRFQSAVGTVSNTANTVVRPVTGTLQSLVNMIPGMQLFGMPNNRNREN